MYFNGLNDPRRSIMLRFTLWLKIIAILPTTLAICMGAAHGAPPRDPEGVPSLDKVFIIVGENTPLSQLNNTNAPYLLGSFKQDASTAWLTNYWATTHYSLANYVAMTSGQFTECQQLDGSPADCHQNAPNLFQLLGSNRHSTWSESMPAPCYLAKSGSYNAFNLYAPKHNPQLYFDNVNGILQSPSNQGSAYCQATNFSASSSEFNPNDMSAFLQALSSNSDKIRAFNLIVPNNCENGHDNCKPAGNPITQFDDFLARVVPAIQNYIRNYGGTLIVTFDEGLDSSQIRAVKFGNGGNVAFAAWGPKIRQGVYNGLYTHYSLLRTLQNGFSVNDTYLGNAANVTPIAEIWKP
jgi:hypothetical protein